MLRTVQRPRDGVGQGGLDRAKHTIGDAVVHVGRCVMRHIRPSQVLFEPAKFWHSWNLKADKTDYGVRRDTRKGGGVATDSVAAPLRPRSPSRASSLRSSISGAHILVALAGILGALLTLTALRDAQRTVGVVAVGRDVAMGNALQPGDLTTVDIGADDMLLNGLYLANDTRALIGKVMVAPIRKGDIVRRSDVRSAAANGGQRSISFALDSADAVAGSVGVGDRIDVVGVAHNGTESAYVLTDASVLSVSNPQSSGPLRSTERKITITVNVAPDAALRLVAAQSAGKIVVVRATGAKPQRVPATLAPEESLNSATNERQEAAG